MDDCGLIEAVRKAAANASFDRGEVHLHASDWMRVMEAITASGGAEEKVPNKPCRLSEEDAFKELGLLYNYKADDSQQFTRWNMICALQHGHMLAKRTPNDVAVCRQAVARVLADGFVQRGKARVTGSAYETFDQMPGSLRKDFPADADALIAASLIAVPGKS